MSADHEHVTLLSAIQGSSEEPAWSPDGTKIAFQHIDIPYVEAQGGSPRDLYVVTSDGHDERRLTSEFKQGGSCEEPSWAPDNRNLVCTCNFDGDYDLYTLDSITSGLQKVTDYPGDESAPSWSPDGRRIAFEADAGEGGRRSIYTISSQGKSLNRLTTDMWSAHPTWSPDSQRIAFSSRESPSRSSLCFVNADGSALTCFDDVPCSAPAWSPSGSRVACVSGSKILLVTVDSGESRELLNASPNFLSGLSWSPDETHIVFTGGLMLGAHNYLYVIEVEK